MEARIRMELNLYASVLTESLLAQLCGTRTPSESLMKYFLWDTQTCHIRTNPAWPAEWRTHTISAARGTQSYVGPGWACVSAYSFYSTWIMHIIPDKARQDSNQCYGDCIGLRLKTMLDMNTWNCNLILYIEHRSAVHFLDSCPSKQNVVYNKLLTCHALFHMHLFGFTNM